MRSGEKQSNKTASKGSFFPPVNGGGREFYVRWEKKSLN